MVSIFYNISGIVDESENGDLYHIKVLYFWEYKYHLIVHLYDLCIHSLFTSMEITETSRYYGNINLVDAYENTRVIESGYYLKLNKNKLWLTLAKLGPGLDTMKTFE